MEYSTLSASFPPPEEIADHWFDALCRTPAPPGNLTLLRTALGDLTVACLHFLTADESDPRAGNEIGIRLARLLSNQPDALGCTQKFWMQLVMQIASKATANEIHARGADLLGEIATGFTRTLYETTLSGQGDITRLIATQTLETPEASGSERELTRTLAERAKQLEEQTRQVQEIYEKYRRQAIVLENVFDAVIVSDTQRRITDWNQGATRMFGYTRNEMLGRDTKILYTDPQRWVPWDEWIAPIQAHGVRVSEFEYRRKDGFIGIGESSLVPLRDDHGTIIGVIGVNRDITTRARLEDALKLHNQELEALNQIADRLAETRDHQTILNQIVHSVRLVVNAERIRLSVPNETETELITRALISNLSEIYDVPLPMHSIIGWVYLHHEELEIPRLADHAWFYEIEGHPEDRDLTGFFVPLLHGEKNLGVLSVMRSGAQPFTQSERELVRALATHAAVALDNVNLFERTQQQLHTLTELDDLSRHLFGLRDPQAIMQFAVTQTAQLLNAQQSSIRLVKGKYLIPGAHVSVIPDDAFDQPLLIQAPLDKILHQNYELVIDENHSIAHPSIWADRMARAGVKTLLALPLHLGQTVLGLFGIARFAPYSVWTSEEISLARNIANIVAIALHNAQQYQDLEHRNYYLSELSEFAVELHAISHLDSVMLSACRCALKVLKGTRSSIRTVEDDVLTVGVSVGYQVPEQREHPIPLDSRLRSIVEDKKPLVISDVRQDPHIPARRLKRMLAEESIAYLGVPMFTQERPIGILSVTRAEPHEWTPEEINFADTVANITAIALERTRNQSAVKDEREQLRAMVDSLQMALFRTDRDGKIIFWNHTAQEISGWRESEVKNLAWRMLFTHKEPTETDLLTKALATNTIQHSYDELVIHTPDHGDIPVSVGLVPLHSQDQIIGIVGNFQDLTEVMQAKNERGEFMANVTHEISTPLSVLLLSLALYTSPKTKRAEREELRIQIDAQARRLKAFSETYLRAGAETPQHASLMRVEIVSLIRQVLTAYPAIHTEHIFPLSAPPLVWARADPGRLERVLFNLYDNAVKYSPRGGKIETTVTILNDKVQIAVRDEGVGIAPAELERIFDRWHRLRTTTGQYAYGHGIGLWIVKLHMTAMQGSVRAESDGHNGSTFYLELQSDTEEQNESKNTLDGH